jgi:isopentenyl-diphosphate delta-isomerase
MDIVLVNNDNEIMGLKEKFLAHKIPVPLHRAISIVIFNPDKTKMLITKRAKTKPTWPGIWSNAVCSHPKDGETHADAADRRLMEELGFKTPLTEAFRFIYSAEMDNKIWGENEYDAVFTGNYEGQILPNPEETSDYKWINVSDLKTEIKSSPKKYTPWFGIILNKLKK